MYAQGRMPAIPIRQKVFQLAVYRGAMVGKRKGMHHERQRGRRIRLKTRKATRGNVGGFLCNFGTVLGNFGTKTGKFSTQNGKKCAKRLLFYQNYLGIRKKSIIFAPDFIFYCHDEAGAAIVSMPQPIETPLSIWAK